MSPLTGRGREGRRPAAGARHVNPKYLSPPAHRDRLLGTDAPPQAGARAAGCHDEDMTDAPAVIDNQAASRFEYTENGRLAQLIYRVRPGRLVLVHTETPPQFQGRGIGSALVRAAIDRAEREHLTVVVYCPFARSWLEQHPAEASRVTIELPEAS